MNYSSCAPNLRAIQVIKCLEKKDDHMKENQSVISVIKEYKDEKGNKGPSLKNVLCGENKDLPIFVISICGKTRTGKSVLLNLMIKYLKSKDSENWKEGDMPNVFEWKGGTDSVTKGLWICPNVFRRRNTRGREVGILLLDNQGLFDGEQTDGVATAISGISTVLSFYQIFNLKDKICENDLESIWRHLMSDDNNLSEDSSATKLMFVVRDYLGEDCGLVHGQAYIEAEKKRGTNSHKEIWKGLQKTFPKINCLLLPFPGEKVRKGKIKKLEDIEPEFLDHLELFFNKMFDPKYLSVTKNILTGQSIFEKLMNFDARVADESLSFVNVFTEQGNQNKFDSLVMSFGSRIESFKCNPTNGQSLMEEFLSMAKKKFKGKSADSFLVDLEKYMAVKINLSVKDWALRKYKYSLQSSSRAEDTHTLQWKSMEWKITNFVGSDAEKNELKEKVITECADVYYTILRKELQSRFEAYSRDKTLDDLEGYDEEYVYRFFKENDDFKLQQSTCTALWIREKQNLRIFAQKRLLEFVAALTEFDSEWLQNASTTQFKYHEVFTWNGCHSVKIFKNDDSLQELVGYTMYKNPLQLCEYPEDQRKEITLITDLIKKHSSSNPITVTCIFILYRHEREESCEPIFKVQNGSEYTFIDIKGRVYKNWADFKNDNMLPPNCLYCYPSEGEYNKKRGFRIGFTWSPATRFGNKLLKVLDVAGKVVAIGSANALAAAAGVAVAPASTIVIIGCAVSGAFVGIYGLVRGVSKIVDKNDHDQDVGASDVVDVVTNSLSVLSGVASGGIALMSTIGKELTCAPAIIQSISSLTNLVFLLDSENISYLSLANDLSIFLLFNSKSLEGAIDNIRKSYSLSPQTSNLNTLKDFIARNSITFPMEDRDTLKTEQFFSESWKSLLLTGIMNKAGKRPLKFLRDMTSSEYLKPLNDAFCYSYVEEQLKFFEELMALFGMIISNKKNQKSPDISYQGMRYHSANVVTSEVALAGICTGLIDIAECSGEETVQRFCAVAKEILKFVYENAGITDLKGLTAYIKYNTDEIAKRFQDMV